jgi:hypothetical protein
MKFKMAATAEHSLKLDPMGKVSQNASSLKPLEQSLVSIFLVVSEKRFETFFP